MENTVLKQTPLYNYHKDLGAKLGPFSGWIMPIQYQGIVAEHGWTRQAGSLFDICHMGEFLIHADPESLESDKIFSLSLPSMPIGKCKYGFMLNQEGGIIDDLVVYRLQEDRWMVVVNAATKDKDFFHINNNASSGMIVEDMSEKTAKLDLQGPFSRDVLKQIAGDAIDSLLYYRCGKFKLLNQESVISRTGYTGELGFEIYVNTDIAGELWDAILADKRVKPAGLGARDTLRLEMGYPLYGQDIDDTTTPLEAGLGVFVDFKKDFIGKEALLKQREEGLSRKLIAFISDTRRSPRHGDTIYSEEKQAGFVSSGSFSPSLGFGIGMGYVENGYDWIGAHISIRNERSELSAQITDRPFYRKGTARD
jgi:aminomethyltransferase